MTPIEVHRYKLYMLDKDYSGTVSFYKEIEKAISVGAKWEKRKEGNFYFIQDYPTGDVLKGTSK